MGRTDSRRGLIEDEQLALADDGTGKGENLALTDRQVAAAARDGRVKCNTALVRLILEREQASSAQGIVQHHVVIEPERIEVLAEGAAEEFRLQRS